MSRRFLRKPAKMMLNQMPKDERERLQKQRLEANEYVCRRLREAGENVTSIDDIANVRGSFPGAVATLTALLDDPKLNDDLIFLGVVAALRDPAAVGIAYEPLVRIYREFMTGNDPIEHQRADDIAITIGYVATKEHVEEVLSMIKDRQTFGGSRLGLVDALVHLDRDRLLTKCRWMLHDRDLTWQVLDLLVRRKLIEFIDEVREMSQSHPDGEFRQRARKALDRLEKMRNKQKPA